MSDLVTWRKCIQDAMASVEDSGPLIACTLSADQLDVPFDCGYGGANGEPFTAWTESRVYFPATYDGAEWCSSVPRNPCDEETEHVGGG
jgi:hypothetical protein